MAALAEATECRMTALIRHFGDTADGLKPCGVCDICAPASAAAAPAQRDPTDAEQRTMRAILRAIDGNGRSTGKLHTDLDGAADRKSFDALLDGLARAGFLTLAVDSFTNPAGEAIRYKKATITHEGRFLDPGDLPVTLRDDSATPGTAPRKRTRSGAKSSAADDTAPLDPAAQRRDDALRAWRKAEAAKTGKPAFIVFGDKTLRAIAHANPQTLSALNAVSGVGPEKLERYGAEILTTLRTNEAPAAGSLAAQPKQALNRPVVIPPSTPQNLSSRPKASQSGTAVERPAFTPPPSPNFQDLSPRPKRSQSNGAAERPASAPPPTPSAATLTPAQLALETRLRSWREAEAERANLPQFFVLGSSTLRQLVLRRPTTLPELRAIGDLDPDKLARFGSALLALCTETPDA